MSTQTALTFGTLPYLTFHGNCREAVEFYARALDASLFMLDMSKTPMPCTEQTADLIMHARLDKNGKVFLMASDDMPEMHFQPGNNFRIHVPCETDAEIEAYFTRLGEGGKVDMPLQETFWAERFAMVTDKFGVGWMFLKGNKQVD